MAPQFRFRRAFLGLLGLLLAALAWKAGWRYGPGLRDGGPALFGPQAQALLRAYRPGPLWATVPPPERGTSAEAQLRLMEVWDGRGWTAKASRVGRVDGRVLRVPAGQLALVRVLAVSPEARVGGRPTCRIDHLLRWDWEDQDLLRVAPIIGLRMPAPAGFTAPGQEAKRTLLVQWQGWHWQARPGLGDPGQDPSSPWLAWLF